MYHVIYSLYMYIISNMTSSISFRLFKTLYGFTECKINEWMNEHTFLLHWNIYTKCFPVSGFHSQKFQTYLFVILLHHQCLKLNSISNEQEHWWNDTEGSAKVFWEKPIPVPSQMSDLAMDLWLQVQGWNLTTAPWRSIKTCLISVKNKNDCALS